MGILLRLRAQSSPHRIKLDVHAMDLVVVKVSNAVIGKAVFPDLTCKSKFFLDAVREATFDPLDGLFQRQCLSGRQDQVKVLRHEHEAMR